jgi:hypothetical protein
MAWFKRKPRVDVGTFEPLPFVEPAPIERVVDEAMMIARTAVRMAVKNRIIVEAIREDRDYDAAAMSEVARLEFATLAERNDDVAGIQTVSRNETVFRLLAGRLREASEDVELIESVVEEARDAAWREISGVLDSRLSSRAVDPRRDPSYELERESRLHKLITVDLARLELERIPQY